MQQPWPLFRLFSVFTIKHFTILQQINVKNVHAVSGAVFQTHNLLIMSLLPSPMDLWQCYKHFTIVNYNSSGNMGKFVVSTTLVS